MEVCVSISDVDGIGLRDWMAGRGSGAGCLIGSGMSPTGGRYMDCRLVGAVNKCQTLLQAHTLYM